MDLRGVDADVANLLRTRAALDVNGVAIDDMHDGAVVRLGLRRRRQDEPKTKQREPPPARHHAATVSPPSRRCQQLGTAERVDRKSTRLNSSHLGISYAVFCL